MFHKSTYPRLTLLVAALCFEFGEDPDSTISFEQYMQMAATFNRPGNREVKLKVRMDEIDKA